MSKPIWETHLTLWNGVDKDEQVYLYALQNKIQSCTVDVAEHERVKKIAIEKSFALIEEVARLKKEVEAERQLRYDLWEQQKAEGVAEGERRAMERVEKAINRAFFKWANDNSVGFALDDIKKELGLGEEEKR